MLPLIVRTISVPPVVGPDLGTIDEIMRVAFEALTVGMAPDKIIATPQIPHQPIIGVMINY
jgi:hypothetical protein